MDKRFLAILACLPILLSIIMMPDVDGSARTLAPVSAFNAYDLIDAVNALRASKGLAAYQVNSILMQTAQAQANYMAATGNITHFGPDGSRPFQRALAAGYPVAGDLSLGGWFSENIQGGTGLSPQQAVNAWMGDAPHQNTMLSASLQDIGAGVAVDGDFYYYVIDCALASGSAVFYTPASGGTVVVVSGTPATQEPTIAAAIVSTPDENGNVYHVVQPGQTLWQIALAYKTTIDQLKRLNNLTADDIYVGQKLLIGRAGTATPIPPAATKTRDPSTVTPFPTFAILTQTPTVATTSIPRAPVSGPARAGGVVLAIILAALVAAGLLAWTGRSRSV
jgi:LysM repeat protein